MEQMIERMVGVFTDPIVVAGPWGNDLPQATNNERGCMKLTNADKKKLERCGMKCKKCAERASCQIPKKIARNKRSRGTQSNST